MTHLVPVLRPVLGSPFRRSDLYRIAGALPALHLSPRITGTWNDLISGSDLTTFSRANTSSTYELDGAGGLVGFSSGQRAIGYSPETGVRGGSLFGQRTQLLASPEDPTSPSGSNAVTFVSSTDSPLPSNAHKLTETTAASAFHYAGYNTGKAASSLEYQATVFVKAAGREVVINLQNAGGSSGVATRFNPATGAYTTGLGAFGTGFTVGTASVFPLANGWYRLRVSCVTDTSTTIAFQLSLHNGTTNVYTGDGTSGVLIAGRNLTQGSVVFPYIGGAITCPADVLTIDGTNFSQWYNQNGGTLLVSASRQVVESGVFPRTLTIYATNDANRIDPVWWMESAIGMACTTNAVDQVNQSLSGYTGVRKRTAAVRFKANDFAQSINGSSLSIDTSATLPTVDTLRIGGNFASASSAMFNGHIHDILYWPPGSPAEQRLQQLSAAL